MSVLSIRASQKFLCSMHLKPKSNEKMYCLEVHALYSIINGRCDRQNTWLASGAVEKKAERRSHAFVGVTDGRNNLPVFWLTATKAVRAAFFMPLSVLQLWFGLQKLLVSQEKTVSTRSKWVPGRSYGCDPLLQAAFCLLLLLSQAHIHCQAGSWGKRPPSLCSQQREPCPQAGDLCCVRYFCLVPHLSFDACLQISLLLPSMAISFMLLCKRRLCIYILIALLGFQDY